MNTQKNLKKGFKKDINVEINVFLKLKLIFSLQDFLRGKSEDYGRMGSIR